MKHLLVFGLIIIFATCIQAQNTPDVPKVHPRLLGTKEHLQKLSKERAEAYQRMAAIARDNNTKGAAKMISQALVCAIENDADLGKKAIAEAMKAVHGPIRVGHETFGSDLAYTALVYDLCFPYWEETERLQFHQYMNKTIDANVKSETAVFHNGWYGYKNWGIGISCYATYYENERAPAYLQTLEKDYRERTAPSLELAGNGGGWGEGYYINYFLDSWLIFCEVAKNCGGLDYYGLAPTFYKNRAVAGMFECYPGLKEYNTHRSIPMGDGGGRTYGGDRDKALTARRILVNQYRNDPTHQVVHTFNERTPHCGTGGNAYLDFLWHDTTVPKGNLKDFKLSHLSPGAGYVYARSSWGDDATYFFFKCGDRFTSHQHLDVGHFLIYKHEELMGDGGHYGGFGTVHDVNYHLRTIAHNTMLIFNPDEKWPGIRAGNVTGNDGGQAHNFPHHNGSVNDADEWQKNKHLYDIADITDYKDTGEYMYVAGDCSRAYSTEKLDYFTRQILYFRPGTFIIFDRVKSSRPDFKKTMLLQTMKPPVKEGKNLVVSNGKGQLLIQNLMPGKAKVNLVSGENLYTYNGNTYPPDRITGPAPECRMEISPADNSEIVYFLTFINATESGTTAIPQATVRENGDTVVIRIGEKEITFKKSMMDITI